MAEVGHRLCTGANRLSVFRTSPSFPVSTRGSPGAVRVTASDCQDDEESNQDQRQVQPKLPGEVSLKLLMRILPGCQADLQKKLVLVDWMASWTRGAVSIPHEAFRTHQQLRSFCSVIFILRSEKPASRLRCTKRHVGGQYTICRGYSWSGDGKTKDTPLMYRSRTAYYDILKVSPNATQSSIKSAYYEQSFIYHPDKNPGSEEAKQMFSEISEAYTVLGNVHLRRNYDRGILSLSDVQGAGRPSSKEPPSRSPGSLHQQQKRASPFFHKGRRVMFDFDAFYRGHYGDQLQREWEMKAKKLRKEEMQKNRKKMKKKAVTAITVWTLLVSAFIIGCHLTMT